MSQDLPQTSSKIRTLEASALQTSEIQEFSLSVLTGLSETKKQLPSRYLYDATGSELFQKITELDEYYPTGCEAEILKSKKNMISNLLGTEPFNLIELGAGDGRKTKILLKHFLKKSHKFRYYPIDISKSALIELSNSLEKEIPDLEIEGIVSEYFNAVTWISKLDKRKNLVLFLGSNIGNFTRSHARTFLHTLWNSLNDGDYVFIGFDLKKKIKLLLDAYNDPKGVTSSFNLNLLKRINRDLGGNFDISKFDHFSNYAVNTGAMESYLISTECQDVYIDHMKQSFHFKAWEPILLEYSYKYSESDIESLASDTGYKILNFLYDEKKYFTDVIWQVNKERP